MSGVARINTESESGRLPDVPAASTMQTAREADAKAIGRLTIRLKIAFMMLTCLGGLVLKAGPESDSVSIIAIFFAIFGFVFVDCLKLFSLPPLAAYSAMALAGVYCVSNFMDKTGILNQQLIAVAELLVLVQAIMMLQRKTRRVFEQLGIFCLLELMVAGVYNNALNYGLLLIAIGLVGAWAMSMLSAIATSEGIGSCELLSPDENTLSFFAGHPDTPTIEVTSSNSASRISGVGVRLPQVALFALAPSILLVSVIFFYALPRKVEANRSGESATALVGFSETMTLDQIGQMSLDNSVAARIDLRDAETGETYKVLGGLYVRGKVLELYRPSQRQNRNTATWLASEWPPSSEKQSIPQRLPVPDKSSSQTYDDLLAEFHCQPSQTATLLSLAPYFGKPVVSISHDPLRWVLTRSQTNLFEASPPRISYRLSTRSFNFGVQSPAMSDWETTEDTEDPDADVGSQASGSDVESRRAIPPSPRQRVYYRNLLAFDGSQMPTVADIANQLSTDPSGNHRSRLATALACQNWLSQPERFEYSLNLDADPIAGMDAVEKFVKVDRKGHCQFFASALAMMLRSQGVPARLVVGYCTDEFNELSGQYIVRQRHAHAWVEGLFDASELPTYGFGRPLGQPKTEKVWLRLDATPVAQTTQTDPGSVRDVFDFAQSSWNQFLIDMAPEKQKELLGTNSVASTMAESYRRFVDRLSSAARSLRDGQLGMGSQLSGSAGLTLVAIGGLALLGMVALIIRALSMSFRSERNAAEAKQSIAVPEIDFYARALRQLERVGVLRSKAQTPRELAVHATDVLEHPLVPSIDQSIGKITDAYYETRFGSGVSQAHRRGSNESAEPGSVPAVNDDASITMARHDSQWEREVVDALAELSHSIDLLTNNDPKTR